MGWGRGGVFQALPERLPAGLARLLDTSRAVCSCLVACLPAGEAWGEAETGPEHQW